MPLKSYKKYYQSSTGSMSVAKKIKKVEKKVRLLNKLAVKQDMGYVNYLTAGAVINGVSRAAVQWGGIIVQGDSSADRTGDVIQPISADFRYTIAMPAALVFDLVRVIVVQVKNAYGSVPTIGGYVLNSATTATFMDSDYNELQVKQKDSPVSTKTVSIVYDKTHITTVNSPVVHVKKHFDLRKRPPMTYSNSAGSNADLSAGGYWLFVLSTGVTNSFSSINSFKWQM